MLVHAVMERVRRLVRAGSRRIGRFPKHLLLWAFLHDSNGQRRDSGERNLPFAQLTMAVILGVVIQGTATSLSRQPFVTNYRAVLLVTSLLVFVEMYIILIRYHERLQLPYVNFYMFGDLIISVMFVSCVTLIANSWDDQKQLHIALEVFAVLFMTLLVRQVVAFIDLVLRSEDVQRVLRDESGEARLDAINFDLAFRNADLRAKLAEIHLIQWALFVPMIADLIGVAFAICALLVFDITWWSWVGLVCFLAYEVVMFVVVVGGTESVQQIQASLGVRPSEKHQGQRSS
jgi:hypothetical protein